MSPYALFITFVLAVCVGLGIGVLLEAIDRWASRNVDRMVDEGLAIFTAADIAADTLAREARKQAFDDWQREVIGLFDAARTQGARTETPIFDAIRRDQFEADALAEIEQLTGGDR